MATTTHDGIDIPLDAPQERRPRRRSKGDPNTAAVLTVFLAILVITALFAGFLGAISGDML